MVHIFTRAHNDAPVIQKFSMDTNKTSNASLLLLTLLPLTFPNITIPRERILPSLGWSNYETVPNSQDRLCSCS